MDLFNKGGKEEARVKWKSGIRSCFNNWRIIGMVWVRHKTGRLENPAALAGYTARTADRAA
jgi:hypothetical protein